MLLLPHLDDIALLLAHMLQCCADEPRALVVLDVSANLADHLRIPKAVQVIILDLKADARHGARLKAECLQAR